MDVHQGEPGSNAIVGFEDGALADGFAANLNHFQPDINNNIVRITNANDMAAATGNFFRRFGTH
jgi:deoxyxylulose-5-phosphate synthase